MLHARLSLRWLILIPLCLLTPISARLALLYKAVIFTLHNTSVMKYKTVALNSDRSHQMIMLLKKLPMGKLRTTFTPGSIGSIFQLDRAKSVHIGVSRRMKIKRSWLPGDLQKAA